MTQTGLQKISGIGSLNGEKILDEYIYQMLAQKHL